jgi:hypothetical protein
VQTFSAWDWQSHHKLRKQLELKGVQVLQTSDCSEAQQTRCFHCPLQTSMHKKAGLDLLATVPSRVKQNVILVISLPEIVGMHNDTTYQQNFGRTPKTSMTWRCCHVAKDRVGSVINNR